MFLRLAVLVAAATCSCDDSTGPAPVLDRTVPLYHSEWEVDSFSVAVDDAGHLHVVQFWEPAILKYSMVTSWPEKHLRNVTAGGDLIDADDSGNIYVLDDNRDLVVKYGLDGEFVREWRIESFDALGRGGLSGIAVSDGGHVCVSDSWRNRILVYTTNGKLIREFGKLGDAAGQLDHPMGLDIADGVLYVADTLNFRVQKFTVYGGYLAAFSSRGTYGETLDPPESVDVEEGTVFVVHGSSIIRYDHAD